MTTAGTSTSPALPQEEQDHDQRKICRPNPIAALIRQGAAEAGHLQGTARATSKVQRMINSLQWRQAHSKDELYPLPLDSGVVLEFRQLQAGEVTGLGTGATVWPAAHVLAKYLERRFPNVGVGEGRRGMEGLRAVDLGSGTGVAGIVAAALGAEAFLTDQEQLLFLMEENAERASRAKARKPKENAGASTVPSSDGTNAEPGAFGEIHVLTYDWGMDDERLSPPLDVILVSDCVLPKLYPIEPLVEAIDRLSGPDTVTIMSYEHRHYQAFDPRRRFEELAAAKGLVKVDVPQARQHPIFSADDIEIWEVRRRQQQQQAQQVAQENPAACVGGATKPESVLVEMLGAADDVTILSSSSPTSLPASREDSTAAGGGAEHEVRTVVSILGERHELAQTPSGAIGCYLWPSAVVMARHLVAVAAPTAAATPSASDAPGDGSPPGGAAPAVESLPGGKVLELGSGVGLVAMTAALLGWEVVSTDKADALPLLAFNVNRCLSSTRRESAGTVDVVEHEWGMDARHLLAGPKSAGNASAAGGTGYGMVICADCVYAGASVEPLLATLCEVCDENTAVLVTNELRSAFDEFLRRARALHFEVEDVHVPEAQMVVDGAKNQRPKPVALKRLRRRAMLASSNP